MAARSNWGILRGIAGRWSRLKSDSRGDIGDDTWIVGNMGSANTSEVRKSLCFLILMVGPRADAFLDVLGKVGVVAETVRIRVIFAASELDPGLETIRQKAGSRCRLNG